MCHEFGKPNIRDWQVSIANQIIAKIMACQIFVGIFWEPTNHALSYFSSGRSQRSYTYVSKKFYSNQFESESSENQRWFQSIWVWIFRESDVVFIIINLGTSQSPTFFILLMDKKIDLTTKISGLHLYLFLKLAKISWR